MSEQRAIVSYDREGDYLEVLWDVREGFFAPTGDERVLKRLDDDGELIGFMIHDLSTLPVRGALDLQLTSEPATTVTQ